MAVLYRIVATNIACSINRKIDRPNILLANSIHWIEIEIKPFMLEIDI